MTRKKRKEVLRVLSGRMWLYECRFLIYEESVKVSKAFLFHDSKRKAASAAARKYSINLCYLPCTAAKAAYTYITS